MTTKTKSAPKVSRAEQTLRTIRLIREVQVTRRAPLAQWQILLTLAMKGGPMSSGEIAEEMGVSNSRGVLRQMVEEKLLEATSDRGRNFFKITPSGEIEAGKVIVG